MPKAGVMVGTACDECGHNWMFHPGITNPSMQACIACEFHGLMHFLIPFLESMMEEPEQPEILIFGSWELKDNG